MPFGLNNDIWFQKSVAVSKELLPLTKSEHYVGHVREVEGRATELRRPTLMQRSTHHGRQMSLPAIGVEKDTQHSDHTVNLKTESASQEDPITRPY